MARSFLYVPADRVDRLARAEQSGADAVIADLKDGVDAAAKDEARATVRDWLATPAPGPARWVRLNDGEAADTDLAALAARALDGVIVPKAGIEAVQRLDHRLVRTEGLDQAAVTALVESGRGVLDLEALARHPLVSRLALGEAELVADLGLDPSPDEHELWPLRMQVVVASAAAGLDAPVGPVSTDFHDLDALADSSDALRRAGFGGRSAIHTDQVPVINAAFSSDPASVARANDLG